MTDKYYDEIKELLINNEITKRVKDYSKNQSDLETYYNVGKILGEAGKHYEKGIVKNYSVKLTMDLNVKYDVSSLNKMRKFYHLIEKMATVSPYLTYSHYVELLSYNDINKIKYYVKKAEHQSLSVRQLREKIKSKEYERLPECTKKKLIDSKEPNIKELIPEPIIIKSNLIAINKISEKIIHKIILEDIENFMNQLGSGYTFVGSEYKIKVGNTYNYIDLLLFNYIYNCFIVIELKVTELKKEYMGQIEIYMNYVDENIKTIYQNKTIGIILVKENNKFIIKYSSDDRIVSRKYEIK